MLLSGLLFRHTVVAVGSLALLGPSEFSRVAFAQGDDSSDDPGYGTGHADSVEIGTEQTNYVVGHVIDFYTTYDGTAGRHPNDYWVEDVAWYFRPKDAGFPWIDVTNDETGTLGFCPHRTGALEFRCVATGSDGVTAEDTFDLSVVGPDRVVLPIDGLDQESTVDWWLDMNVPLRFKLASGDTLIGSYAEGFAQERIFVDFPFLPPPPQGPPNPSPWVPSPDGDMDRFYFEPPDIVDHKRIGFPSVEAFLDWQGGENGVVIGVLRQKLKVTISDYSGDVAKDWVFEDDWRGYFKIKVGWYSFKLLGGQPVPSPSGP